VRDKPAKKKTSEVTTHSVISLPFLSKKKSNTPFLQRLILEFFSIKLQLFFLLDHLSPTIDVDWSNNRSFSRTCLTSRNKSEAHEANKNEMEV
jgi:hypothetical protein